MGVSQGGVLAGIDRGIAALEYIIIGGLTVLGMVLGTAQVVMRYCFNTGFTWTEPIFTLATIAAMLFAGSRAVREDKHVRVDLLRAALSPTGQYWFDLFSVMVALALCALFTYCGLLYVLFVHSIETVSPDTGIPEWMIYSLVPVSMGLFTIRYVLRLIDLVQGRRFIDVRQAEVEAALASGGAS